MNAHPTGNQPGPRPVEIDLRERIANARRWIAAQTVGHLPGGVCAGLVLVVGTTGVHGRPAHRITDPAVFLRAVADRLAGVDVLRGLQDADRLRAVLRTETRDPFVVAPSPEGPRRAMLAEMDRKAHEDHEARKAKRKGT